MFGRHKKVENIQDENNLQQKVDSPKTKWICQNIYFDMPDITSLRPMYGVERVREVSGEEGFFYKWRDATNSVKSHDRWQTSEEKGFIRELTIVDARLTEDGLIDRSIFDKSAYSLEDTRKIYRKIIDTVKSNIPYDWNPPSDNYINGLKLYSFNRFSAEEYKDKEFEPQWFFVVLDYDPEIVSTWVSKYDPSIKYKPECLEDINILINQTFYGFSSMETLLNDFDIVKRELFYNENIRKRVKEEFGV